MTMDNLVSRHNRQRETGRILRSMVDRLERGKETRIRPYSLSCVHVAIEPREVAARNLKSYTVSLPEKITCGPQIDLVLVHLVRLN